MYSWMHSYMHVHDCSHSTLWIHSCVCTMHIHERACMNVSFWGPITSTRIRNNFLFLFVYRSKRSSESTLGGTYRFLHPSGWPMEITVCFPNSWSIYVYIHTYIHICMYVCIERERESTHMYMKYMLLYAFQVSPVYVCMYVCMFIYIYIYIYIYIMHTHLSLRK